MQQAAIQLNDIFQDVTFAWQLLNAQIEIQMRNLVSGQTIAYLLQLYMRGVQRMNSLGDPRESYFKNKVTSLMTKQTVIKSLKQNPMKKKSKPDEVPAKQDTKKTKKQNDRQKTPSKKKSKKQESKQQKPVEQIKEINQLQLRQKRRQLQMRMAYVAEQHGPDSLKKIIAQQDHRQQNIANKISKIINSHEQRLKQRIEARKLRTATFKTRSEITMQESQTMNSNEYNQNDPMKESNGSSPFEKISLDLKMLQDRSVNCSNQFEKQKVRLRHKSLQLIRVFESPQKKKIRKYTHDYTGVGILNEP